LALLSGLNAGLSLKGAELRPNVGLAGELADVGAVFISMSSVISASGEAGFSGALFAGVANTLVEGAGAPNAGVDAVPNPGVWLNMLGLPSA